MTIVISADANDDLVAIGDYIAKDSTAHARLTISNILARIRELEQFPLLGRRGAVDGTRELVVPRSFIVVYVVREDDDLIEIIAIARAAQHDHSLGRSNPTA